jgi:hypothetical protein
MSQSTGALLPHGATLISMMSLGLEGRSSLRSPQIKMQQMIARASYLRVSQQEGLPKRVEHATPAIVVLQIVHRSKKGIQYKSARYKSRNNIAK